MRLPDLAAGPRLALRELTEVDAAALTIWLAEAVATSKGRKAPSAQDEALARQLLASHRPQPLVAVQRDGGAPIGLLVYRLGEPEADWVTIAFLAMAPLLRGRGLGGEAVLAFEEAAASQGWGANFRVPIHPDNGLALYFWLRLGYRPVSPCDFVFQPAAEAALWMVRRNP